MHTSIGQPPTGVCQANKEPDQREMELTVLQVSGMGVTVSRKADRAKREEAALIHSPFTFTVNVNLLNRNRFLKSIPIFKKDMLACLSIGVFIMG